MLPRIDDVDLLVRKEGVRVREVAHEEFERVVVVAWIDGLREVDDRDRAVPVEHVVRRQVRVDAVMGEEEINIPQDALVDAGGRIEVELYSNKNGRWVLDVPEVLHQNHRSYALDRVRDIGACRTECPECAELVADPGAELVRLAVLRLVAEGAEHARIGASPARTALLVHAIALEAPRLERAVDFRGDEVPIERRMGATAEDDGFLAALDGSDDLDDQVLFDQRSEVLKQFLFDRLLLRLGRLGRRVLARRSTLDLSIVVVADDASSDSPWRLVDATSIPAQKLSLVGTYLVRRGKIRRTYEGRSMRRMLVLVALLVAGLVLGVVAAPRIAVDSATYTYPDVVSGIAVTHTFVLSNVGNEELVISKVESSCHCTTTQLSSSRVAPGASVSLPVVFDTYEFAGQIDRQIEVTSNDPATPRLDLRLSGRVLRREAHHKAAGEYLNEVYVLLDVREPAAYAAGHFLGAMNVPAGQAAALARLLPPSLLYFCYDQDGSTAPGAATALRAGGLAVVRVIQGGIAAWSQRQPWSSLLAAGADATWGLFLDASGARGNYAGSSSAVVNIASVGYFLTIDLRSAAAFALGHLAGAVNMTEASATSYVAGLPGDVKVLLVSDRGAESDRLAQTLLRQRSGVSSLLGGLVEWQGQHGNLLLVASAP